MRGPWGGSQAVVADGVGGGEERGQGDGRKPLDTRRREYS